MKLIMLKGMGIQGKSHIVNEFLRKYPNAVHLPQTNREYYETHDDVRDHVGIYEFYKNRMKDYPFENDKIYITERSYLDYLLYFEFINNFQKDPMEYKLSDGLNWKCDIITQESAFLNKFSEVEVVEMYNEDIDWLKNYFKSLDKSHVHKKCYTSRGVYISYQDRWEKAFNKYKNLYISRGVTTQKVIFKNFIEDNNKLAQSLIELYDPELSLL